MRHIRVLLADDHKVVRAGLRAVLSTARDIDVVAEAASGEETLELVDRLMPDVVLMDLSMPGMGGAAATRELLARNVRSRVLVLTMHSAEQYALSLLESGAAGYLSKSSADTELVDAVRTIASGGSYSSSWHSASNAGQNGRLRPSRHDAERLASLTQRERDVLRLLACDTPAGQIAERLFIGASTVETYKQRLVAKLGYIHPAEHLDFALRTGLIDRAPSIDDDH